MVQELKAKEYPYDRLKTLKLPSMQYRRDRGDKIETYKFTHGKYTSKYPFTNEEDISRRGHNLKLKKGRFHTNLRQHFWKIYQYTLNSIPATRSTFSIEYEEDEE